MTCFVSLILIEILLIWVVSIVVIVDVVANASGGGDVVAGDGNDVVGYHIRMKGIPRRGKKNKDAGQNRFQKALTETSEWCEQSRTTTIRRIHP